MSDPTSMLPSGVEYTRTDVPVGRVAIPMFLVKDPNGLAMQVDPARFGEDERIPFWAELWPAAIALSGFLERRGRLDGRRVVELGCGTGLVGVMAALLGGDVLFTDFEEEALAFAAANHALNLGRPGATRLVDWRQPPDDLTGDLILASDVLYERRFLQPFVAILVRVVRPGGIALVAEPDRQVAVGALDDLDDRGFARELHLEEVVLDGVVRPVWIHELQAPA